MAGHGRAPKPEALPVPEAPPPPERLGEAGAELWAQIQAWNLDERETAVLLRACRLADVEQRLLDELAAGPLVTKGSKDQQVVSKVAIELRNVSLAVCRLLSSLELRGADQPRSMTSIRAGNASSARWAEHNRMRARREALGG